MCLMRACRPLACCNRPSAADMPLLQALSRTPSPPPAWRPACCCRARSSWRCCAWLQCHASAAAAAAARLALGRASSRLPTSPAVLPHRLRCWRRRAHSPLPAQAPPFLAPHRTRFCTYISAASGPCCAFRLTNKRGNCCPKVQHVSGHPPGRDPTPSRPPQLCHLSRPAFPSGLTRRPRRAPPAPAPRPAAPVSVQQTPRPPPCFSYFFAAGPGAL